MIYDYLSLVLKYFTPIKPLSVNGFAVDKLQPECRVEQQAEHHSSTTIADVVNDHTFLFWKFNDPVSVCPLW